MTLTRENISVYITTSLLGAGIGLLIGAYLATRYAEKKSEEFIEGDDNEYEIAPEEANRPESEQEEAARLQRIAKLEEAVRKEEERYQKERDSRVRSESPDELGEDEDDFGDDEDEGMSVYEMYPEIFDNYEVTEIQAAMLAAGQITPTKLIDLLEETKRVNYTKVVKDHYLEEGINIDEETKVVLYLEGDGTTPPKTDFKAEYSYDPEEDVLYRRMKNNGHIIPLRLEQIPFSTDTLDLAYSALSHLPVGSRVMVHDLEKDALYTIKLMKPWPEPTNVFEKFANTAEDEEDEDIE